MEEYLSITEFARLRGISSETLRHYDRIGLLKPHHTDENGVRYYSFRQYEKLGMIRELKQTGLTLGEIREYYAERNFKTTCDLLRQQQRRAREHIAALQRLEQKLTDRLQYLEDTAAQPISDGQVRIKHIPQRRFLRFDKMVRTEADIAYAIMDIEHTLFAHEELLPTYASARYMGLFSQSTYRQGDVSTELLVLCEGEPVRQKTYTAPNGVYCCAYHKGNFWNRTESVNAILAYGQAQGLRLDERIYETVYIDSTVSELWDERIYEMQIRILP